MNIFFILFYLPILTRVKPFQYDRSVYPFLRTHPHNNNNFNLFSTLKTTILGSVVSHPHQNVVASSDFSGGLPTNMVILFSPYLQCCFSSFYRPLQSPSKFNILSVNSFMCTLFTVSTYNYYKSFKNCAGSTLTSKIVLYLGLKASRSTVPLCSALK